MLLKIKETEAQKPQTRLQMAKSQMERASSAITKAESKVIFLLGDEEGRKTAVEIEQIVFGLSGEEELEFNPEDEEFVDKSIVEALYEVYMTKNFGLEFFGAQVIKSLFMACWKYQYASNELRKQERRHLGRNKGE